MKTRKSKRCAGRVATSVLKVRCDNAFKERVRDHAKGRGEEMSAWIRRTLRAAMDREATFQFRPPPQLDPADLAQHPQIVMDEED